MSRIYLSPPDTGLTDQAAINRGFEGGWIAPLGPEVDAFEAELASVTNRAHGVALSSGTAALHLALLLLGVGEDDRVLVSSLTFSATLNAISYVGAKPVLIDSEPDSWNMDPNLLAEALESGEYAGLHSGRHLWAMRRLQLDSAGAGQTWCAPRLRCRRGAGCDPSGRTGWEFRGDGRLVVQRQQDHHYQRGRGDGHRRRRLGGESAFGSRLRPATRLRTISTQRSDTTTDSPIFSPPWAGPSSPT